MSLDSARLGCDANAALLECGRDGDESRAGNVCFCCGRCCCSKLLLFSAVVVVVVRPCFASERGLDYETLTLRQMNAFVIAAERELLDDEMVTEFVRQLGGGLYQSNSKP
jgi:hypothetical protein